MLPSSSSINNAFLGNHLAPIASYPIENTRMGKFFSSVGRLEVFWNGSLRCIGGRGFGKERRGMNFCSPSNIRLVVRCGGGGISNASRVIFLLDDADAAGVSLGAEALALALASFGAFVRMTRFPPIGIARCGGGCTGDGDIGGGRRLGGGDISGSSCFGSCFIVGSYFGTSFGSCFIVGCRGGADFGLVPTNITACISVTTGRSVGALQVSSRCRLVGGASV